MSNSTDAFTSNTMRGVTSDIFVGKYKLITKLGEGGTSEVFLTLAQGSLGSFQKLVAVKLLRSELSLYEDCRLMFLREARLSAKMNHPNLVQTHDFGEDNGQYYIAMEYLEGQTYHRVRRARDSNALVPLRMRLRVLIDVLAGLHYAHDLADHDRKPLHIVHRDVTPSNVFITYEGQVKLLDFGIAKVIDANTKTKIGEFKGKARYVAPEQLSGESVDRRADVYAVGVMLWETLTHLDIWHGSDETEIVERAALGDVPPLPSTVPEPLKAVCAKAMAPKAEQRYRTAEAMRSDLELYLLDSATPSRERGLGAAVSELFQEERDRVRQGIDARIKGSRPDDPELLLQHEVQHEVQSSSEHIVSATGNAKGVAMTSKRAQTNYGGQPAQPNEPPLESGPKHLSIILVSLSVGAALSILFAIKWRHDRSVDAVASTTSAAASVPAAAPPTTGARPVEASVRGISDEEITLGMSAVFSGLSRDLGNGMKLGLETAFAMVNDAGGVHGRQIKLIALDDGYDAKRARANVQELISDRGVFAIIGNVGTPTANEALPYVRGQKTLFFGALTGANLLRRDPPDRYVFNYRASYEEETAKMVGYLLDVKKVPDRSIVVFAQNDGYGDAAFEGAAKTLRKRGHSDDLFRVGYDRNKLDVDDAINKVLEYNDASVRVGNYDRVKHPVKAIIMAGTYKASAKFIQGIRKRIEPLFLNVSFVGSKALADELAGSGTGVIVTQVVPHFDSGATGVLRYRDALAKYHPDQQPDFISLEGFIVGQLFIEGVRRAGPQLDTERLVESFERLREYDPAIGGNLSFGVSQHQASHKVWGTVLDAQGVFKPLDME